MPCSIDGCDSEPKKRGLCAAHYSLFYRTGVLEKFASSPSRGKYMKRELQGGCAGVAECGKKQCARGFCSSCYQNLRKTGALDLKPPQNSADACAVDGCLRPPDRRGMCTSHYEKFLKYGDPLAYAPRRTGTPCAFEECGGLSVARGLCRACYSYGLTHGWGASRFKALAKREEDIVDDQGYVMVRAPDHPNARKSSKRVPKHRLVMSEFLGRGLRENENVHHINGNKSDNDISNLELWVTAQPKGQRPQDLLEYAKRIIRTYARDSDKLSKIANRHKK